MSAKPRNIDTNRMHTKILQRIIETEVFYVLYIKYNSYKYNRSIYCIIQNILHKITYFFASPSRYAPIGILFLVAKEVVQMTDPMVVLRQLGLYMATVIGGLAIHGFVVLPLIFLVVTRSNPLRYIAGMASALLTAFGTASR